MRERNKCKPFKWFMEEVAFDLIKHYPLIEPPDYCNGTVRKLFTLLGAIIRSLSFYSFSLSFYSFSLSFFIIFIIIFISYALLTPCMALQIKSLSNPSLCVDTQLKGQFDRLDSLDECSGSDQQQFQLTGYKVRNTFFSCEMKYDLLLNASLFRDIILSIKLSVFYSNTVSLTLVSYD